MANFSFKFDLFNDCNLESVKSVSYEEFAANVFNAEWTGWKDLIDIEKHIKKSKYYDDPISHMYLFLNNYWLEEAVRKELNLEYNGKDHERIYAYRGINSPDFKDKSGKTYELKQGYNIQSLERISDRDWHGANVKLFYSRLDKALFEVTKEKVRMICKLNVKHINPDNGLKLKDIAI